MDLILERMGIVTVAGTDYGVTVWRDTDDGGCIGAVDGVICEDGTDAVAVHANILLAMCDTDRDVEVWQ